MTNEKIEKDADFYRNFNESTLLASIAISLKRIADSLEKPKMNDLKDKYKVETL